MSAILVSHPLEVCLKDVCMFSVVLYDFCQTSPPKQLEYEADIHKLPGFHLWMMEFTSLGFKQFSL